MSTASPLVSIRGLGYAYPPLDEGDEPVWVLDGVHLDIVEGEFLSLTGATGSGKTTLCLAIAGIVPRSTGGTIRGEVRVAGASTKTEPVAATARDVGLVFQDPETQLFNTSVEAEIAFGLESLGVAPGEMSERIEWAASRVGVCDLLDRSPHQLSGGQKQRVAIAAVLAMMPRVLVLDEPTANLDPLGKNEVFEALRDLRRDHAMTVIMAGQDAERIAEFSDQVAVLDRGRLVRCGPPAEIYAVPGPLRALGVAVPVLDDLAERLNRAHGTTFSFSGLDDAARTLGAALTDDG